MSSLTRRHASARSLTPGVESTSIRIVEMPDLGALTDNSSVVGEHAGSGRFMAPALRNYLLTDAGTGYVHNGLFNVAQRGNGVWIGSSLYTADRWLTGATGTDVINVSRQPLTDGERAAIGDEAAAWYLGNTFAGSAAGFQYINQPIEGVRRLAGKPIIVSFWANANVALKLGVNLAQVFGTGGSPSSSVLAQATGQAATLSTTWRRYSFAFTMPGTNGQTLGTNGDDHTLLRFYYSAGTAENAASGNIGVQSGSTNLWGVQLEVAAAGQTQPSPLKKRSQQEELAECQRFYQTGLLQLSGTATAGFGVSYGISLPVQMRASPTLTVGTPSVNLNAGASVISSAMNGGFIALQLNPPANGACAYGNTFYASADL